MRKLTALERVGLDLLLEEAALYLADSGRYPLKPGHYEGTLVSHRMPRKGPPGSMMTLEQRENSEVVHLSIYFERPPWRPARDWTMTVRLDKAEGVQGIARVSIAKEYHGMGNGQYLLAERINGEWRITHSEYD